MSLKVTPVLFPVCLSLICNHIFLVQLGSLWTAEVLSFPWNLTQDLERSVCFCVCGVHYSTDDAEYIVSVKIGKYMATGQNIPGGYYKK